MAVHTYGTTNIAFSSFDTWSNNVSSDSNVTMNDALGDAVPSNSNQLVRFTITTGFMDLYKFQQVVMLILVLQVILLQIVKVLP